MAEKLNRAIPVRVSIVAVNVLAFCGTVWAIVQAPDAATYAVQAFMFLSGVCGTAIAGDSWRPSGFMKVNADA